MVRASINVWKEGLEGVDSDLSGKTYLFIPNTNYMWAQIAPSEKLSAVISLLEPTIASRDTCKNYKLEADLVMELGFEVVNWLTE